MVGYWASPDNLQGSPQGGVSDDAGRSRHDGSATLTVRAATATLAATTTAQSKYPFSHENPMSNAPFAPRGTTAEIEQGSAFVPKFDESGLIPAIATDAASGDVLMFAWMNAQALERTIETGWATYWSRSRKVLWVKGETSSNRQRVIELRTDCDQDVVWIRVEVEGHGASCHTGHVSCFYRAVPIGQPVSVDTRLQPRGAAAVVEPAAVYAPREK